MKKLKILTTEKELEEFVNNSDNNILSIDIKSVEQSAFAQQYFIAIIFYEENKELLEKEKSIDWEQRRYEIVKECMGALIPFHETITMHDTAQLAIEYADELIKQLKGE